MTKRFRHFIQLLRHFIKNILQIYMAVTHSTSLRSLPLRNRIPIYGLRQFHQNSDDVPANLIRAIDVDIQLTSNSFFFICLCFLITSLLAYLF